MEPRETIVQTFAKWTAVSSSRRGDLRKGKELYPLIEDSLFDELFISKKSITEPEFKRWHEITTKKIARKMSIGWAAKLINVYLKTRVYVAGGGRPDLVEFIHPPIDGILWKKIKEKYGKDPDISDKLNIFTTIKAIKKYDQYERIIDLCRKIAEKQEWLLIEVDGLWDPEGY